MPTLKNRLFQPVGVLLGDGRMLHLQSRQAIEVSSADLDSPHLQSMLASEQLMLTEPSAQVSVPPRRQPPEPVAAEPAPAEAEETESRRHKGRRGARGYRGEDKSE